MRALTTALASAMVLSLIGCGGESAATDVAKSKVEVKEAAKDSMKAYLENHNQPAKRKH
jgi:uncharacterized protein YggE